MASDYDLSPPLDRLMRSCKYYGRILFPHSQNDFEDWVRYSFYKCQEWGVSPASLAEKRAPNLSRQNRSSL